MNIWHDIDPSVISSTDFTAVIEIPKGSSCKYEMDKYTGLLKLDRVLYTSTHYPANYGFIPRTFADDGDPLDVLVLGAQPIYPMTLIQVYPIGVMRMIDGGSLDDKIIAIPFSDPSYNNIRTIDELPSHIFDEMMHFFSVYKQLENKQTAVKELFGPVEAQKIIDDCIQAYREKFNQ
ncbi:MAG: inorganic diphosphatase [Clostridia bacterium]|nr:inorganic diphosphatase [Clostridia bacterium]MBQ8331368.1 inorganic diphosphatase [Clostridia bacterium]